MIYDFLYENLNFLCENLKFSQVEKRMKKTPDSSEGERPAPQRSKTHLQVFRISTTKPDTEPVDHAL